MRNQITFASEDQSELPHAGKQAGEKLVQNYNDVTTAADKTANALNKLTGALTGNRTGGTGNLSMYDTGGYTGNWKSSEGRLAILHQKELVLNEDDTDKMLKTVDIVRNISNVVNLNNSIDFFNSKYTTCNSFFSSCCRH